MSHGDRFFRCLCVLLLGYALVGKSFAYLGVAPLYVGELTMAYGVMALLFSENWSRVLRTAWLWPLIALMAWGALRTFPYLNVYGTDALHDAAMWMWGTFAIVIASLLAAQPQRLVYLEGRFRIFAKWLLIIAPVSYAITIFANASLPNAPWADVPYILVKGGDLVVHLAGIFAFVALLGGMQIGFVVPMMIVNLVLYFTGRASMVTIGACVGLVALVRPRTPMLLVFPAMVLGVLLLWIGNVEIQTAVQKNSRTVSAEQVVENIESLFTDSDNQNLEGSKQWRLGWWDDIIQYTVHGPYFWQGKGFGINLADDDGYQVEADHSLRNPHNGHLTMLARGGVPMLALWVICQMTLACGLLSGAWKAHRRGDRRWFGLLFFLFVYWLAFLINASFDVFLEGPVGGIWFWCVYGTGMGAIWIYQNQPEALQSTAVASAHPGRHEHRARRRIPGLCAS